MTCCGKTKQALTKGKNIAKGFTNYATGKKFEFTDGRIRTCQKCDKNKWIGKTLWCTICNCFIPAKASVESEKCPLGLWAK